MLEKTEQFVSVPVPAEYVTRVMALVAALSTGDETPVTVKEPEPAVAAADANDVGKVRELLPGVPWSVDDLARLASASLFTTRTVAHMLDVLAETPGRWHTTTDLVDRLGIVRSNLKGVLSALTRHVRKHYRRSNWPLTTEWGPNLGDHPAEMHYRLDDEAAAARWREARARGGGTS